MREDTQERNPIPAKDVTRVSFAKLILEVMKFAITNIQSILVPNVASCLSLELAGIDM